MSKREKAILTISRVINEEPDSDKARIAREGTNMEITHEMTREEADRLYRLAWFIETQVPEKNLYQSSYRSIANGETEDSLMLAECNSTCCALGWTAYLWPKEWEWVYEGGGVPHLRQPHSTHYSYRDADRFFGLTYDEVCAAFGTMQRTPKQQAALLRSFAEKRGYKEQGTQQNDKICNSN